MPIRSSVVRAAIPPRTDQTNGLCPCRSIHGWKWSEISANGIPAASAATAFSTRSAGVVSSLESAYPSSMRDSCSSGNPTRRGRRAERDGSGRSPSLYVRVLSPRRLAKRLAIASTGPRYPQPQAAKPQLGDIRSISMRLAPTSTVHDSPKARTPSSRVPASQSGGGDGASLTSRREAGSGRSPSSSVRQRTGAPAAHACGRAAVG